MGNLEFDSRFKEFINFVSDMVKEEKEEEVITSKVSRKLETLINQGNIIPEVFKRPNTEKYTLYPLYVAPDNSFSIASAVWDVGQSTPIHDHGTWGVIGILQGEEREIHYEISSLGSPLEKKNERKLRAGEVAVCCTKDQDVHEVSCLSNIPCVGIHVYGNNIGVVERNVYDPETGRKKSVITPWDPVPSIEN